MDRTVSATNAKRKFFLVLRGVRAGNSYVVTNQGRPIARIVPAAKHDRVALAAHAALLSRLERQPVVKAASWSRDELYEDER